MEHHNWVHLAFHAHQDVSNPTKSGFHLQDGTLDLTSINRRSFKNKGLAFLSACQTATGDEKLPDDRETTHLASGMLMAGYSSVIAAMWSVWDEDAPFVAAKVYAELMKDVKLENGEAGNALHYAVAELRDKLGEQKFECWVPYIHIGSQGIDPKRNSFSAVVLSSRMLWNAMEFKLQLLLCVLSIYAKVKYELAIRIPNYVQVSKTTTSAIYAGVNHLQ